MAITQTQPPTVTTPTRDYGSSALDHGKTVPLSDCNHYRWSLTVGADSDTFATGIPGIVEAAITGQRTRTTYGSSVEGYATNNCRISAISAAGVVTFRVAGSTDLDLLVWAK